MPNDDFISGCRYLMKLRPAVYRWADLRFWTFEQLAEELADVAMQEDQP